MRKIKNITKLLKIEKTIHKNNLINNNYMSNEKVPMTKSWKITKTKEAVQDDLRTAMKPEKKL